MFSIGGRGSLAEGLRGKAATQRFLPRPPAACGDRPAPGRRCTRAKTGGAVAPQTPGDFARLRPLPPARRPGAWAGSAWAASRCPSARSRRSRAAAPGVSAAIAAAIRSAWASISASAAAEHPQRGHLAERPRLRRETAPAWPPAPPASVCPRGGSAPADSCGSPRIHRALPRMMPPCGPPIILSALHVTRSAPAATDSGSVGSFWKPNREKSIKRPAPTSSITDNPAIWPSPHQFLQRHLGGEALDLVVARMHAEDGGGVRR